MTKFQRIQKISSIIPFYSSIFVFIVTMIELKRKHASAKYWFLFCLTFFLSGILVYILNAVVMTGQHPVLNVIASGLLLAAANIICVDIQAKCPQKGDCEKPRNNKKIIIICCIIAGIFVVTVSIAVLILLTSPSIDIEDSNGSDTNLAVITMDEILTTKNHFSAFCSYFSNSGQKTKVAKALEDYDYDKVAFGCEKISGIKILQATKTECNQLTLNIESTLESGNMEIIIIVNNEYYDSVAVNQTHTIVLDNIAEKQVVLKFAAESAKMHISVTRELS